MSRQVMTVGIHRPGVSIRSIYRPLTPMDKSVITGHKISVNAYVSEPLSDDDDEVVAG